MKEDRAEEIAKALNDNERWHSHNRGISMQTLREELNLRIDDLGELPELWKAVRSYYGLFSDYLVRENATNLMIFHTRNYL